MKELEFELIDESEIAELVRRAVEDMREMRDVDGGRIFEDPEGRERS